VGLEDDNAVAATSEATQEERMYRAWVNSMDLGDIHVSDVYADAANTVLLLKVIDNVRPGCVDWKRVNTTKLNNVGMPLRRVLVHYRSMRLGFCPFPKFCSSNWSRMRTTWSSCARIR
jgi:hypothetical protein